jgi:hypothetical protein
MVKLPSLSKEVVQTSPEYHSVVHVRSAVDECEKNTSTSLLVCVNARQNFQIAELRQPCSQQGTRRLAASLLIDNSCILAIPLS